MKKRILTTALLLVLMPALLHARAFSGELFNIEIDSRFSQAEDTYVWQTADGAANVNIVVNRNSDRLNIWKLDESDLPELESQFAEQIQEEIDAQFPNSDVSVMIETLQSSLESIGEYPAILMDLQTTYVIGENVVKLHQYAYILTSKNYMYVITFTFLADSANASLLQSRFDMMESFVIQDELYTKPSLRLKPNSVLPSILIGGCLGGGLALVIVLFSRRNKNPNSPVPPMPPPI